MATQSVLEDLLEVLDDDDLGDALDELLAMAEPTDVSKIVERKPGEARNAFISRCMSAEKEAIPDRRRRLAACFRKFRARKADSEEDVEETPAERLRRRRRQRKDEEPCCGNCAQGRECSDFGEHRPGRIVKKNEALQLVTAEVYLPNFPDAHGDFMTPEEIRKMAHRFLAEGRTGQVDVDHDNDTSRGMRIVESFIARKDDPDFIADSWVVTIHVADPDTWSKVQKGEINGLSMQAEVFVREKVLDLPDIPEEVSGTTFDGSGGNLHSHGFSVRFDADGNFRGGVTTITDGHRHEIRSRSVTEPGGEDGHRHRYSFQDQVLGERR